MRGVRRAGGSPMAHQGERRRIRLPTLAVAAGLAVLALRLFSARQQSDALDATPGQKSYVRRALQRPVYDPERCAIHIFDVSAAASRIGVPACNINDTNVWPHDADDQGLQGMRRTPHWAYQHGAGHWITQAILNSSLVTDSMAGASMIYVDLYCYNQWFHSWSQRHRNKDAGAGTGASPQAYVQAVIEHISRLPEFLVREVSNGTRFVWHMPAPAGAAQAMYGKYLCTHLRQGYSLIPELGFVCWELNVTEWTQRRQGAVLPYNAALHLELGKRVVGSDRPTFLSIRSGCSDSPNRSSGMLQRAALIKALAHTAVDIKADCTCAVCPDSLPHDALQAELRSSLFCPVLAGDTAASNRLSEVVLAGCLPVFVGPPWHALPLAGDGIDYLSFSIFINISNTSPWILANTTDGAPSREMASLDWASIASSGAVVTLTSLRDVVPYLRSLPEAEIARRQAALEGARPMFSYMPVGASSSALGEEIVHGICRRGAALQKP